MNLGNRKKTVGNNVMGRKPVHSHCEYIFRPNIVCTIVFEPN